MAFTKYASLESAQILDLKGSKDRSRTASLSKLGEFEDYRTEDGYLYARIRAISSRVNKNHDGWPSVELAGGSEPFDRHHGSEGGFTVEADASQEHGYSTFLGKPIFVDHHNSDPDRARGVIVDAKLHVEDHKTASLDPYYSSDDVDPEHLPATWVELLLEVDAKSFPKLAKAIIEGGKNPDKGIDGFSMGCDVEKSICNICKNAATSPDEYCQHVRMKGATFKDRTGKVKKSYENCYGIKFFEISAVFDPADETALVKEVKTAADLQYGDRPVACPDCDGTGEDPATMGVCTLCSGKGWAPITNPGVNGGSLPREVTPDQVTLPPMSLPSQPMYGKEANVKTAANPLPQADLLHAPEQIDTLREETICPVCGSTMESEQCDVCSYIEPPEGFDNPDLSKAQQTELRDQAQDGENDAFTDLPEGALGPDTGDQGTSNLQPFAHVKGDMAWNVSLPSRVAERQVAVPNSPPATDEPGEDVLVDSDQPITSHVRTAQDFIAAAGARRRNTMDHTADAASGAPAVATPDKNVDVVGVGGVLDASNEEASRADAQIDVAGVGGTGVEGVAADSTEGLPENSGDAGFDHKKNVEQIPTKTFDNGSSGVERQADPVSSEPFPASADGVKRSAWTVEAHEDEAFPTELPRIGEGQSAEQGTQPADAVGVADERVDVLQAVTSPSNNSGPTTTWSGTDGNGVTKQQDPVTQDTLEGNDGVKSAHIFAAFKLADLEVELGLLPAERKFERVAALEQVSGESLQAQLEYAQRVKTAGLNKRAKTAGRVPVLGRNASTEVESSTQSEDNIPDEALFS